MELILRVPAELQNAALPVRWCLDKELRERLAELKILHPHLLLVWHDGREEFRELVPLADAIKYISFFRPGMQRLLAAIVWPAEGKTPGHLKKYFFSRGNYDWENTAIDNWRGKGEIHLTSNQYVYEFVEEGLAQLDLEIPEGVFAPEPPAWLKKWVYMYIKQPAKDACHFREKLLFFAIPIQPFIFILHMLGLMAYNLFKIVFTLVGALVMLAITPLTMVNPLRLSLMPAIMPWRYEFDSLLTENDYNMRHSLWRRWRKQYREWKWDRQHRTLTPEEKQLQEEKQRKEAEAKELAQQRKIALEEKLLQRQLARVRKGLENLACNNLTTDAVTFVRPVQKVYLVFWGAKERVCKPFKKP